MRISLIYLFITFCSGINLYSQKDTSHVAIIYGNDNSYTIKAPIGWVLDTKSGVSDGLFAVFYPESSSWKDAISVMYVNTASKKATGNETLQKVIEFDENRFRNENGGEITDELSMITGDNKIATVKKFYDKKNKNYESVAYIDEINVVVFLVLSSADKGNFDKSYNSFKELVESYKYLTDNFKIDK